MKTVHVNLGRRGYDILVGEGLLEKMGQLLDGYRVGRRLFLLSNSTVFDLLGRRLKEQLAEQGFQVAEILIPDGEQHKTLDTVGKIYTCLIAQRADRQSTLAALGGGVTGDIAGFVAATFMRGIPYIQIPTTLLAQVDSSVGGKTGVNHDLGKNMIGAFYQPDLVCLDTSALATLPQREFLSGVFEIVKYGLIYDRLFFDFVEQNLEQIRKRDADTLGEVITRCCEIKAEITAQDEKERSLRRILNFGHTFGHALEAACDFKGLTHGEAVGYGMLAALRLSVFEQGLDRPTEARVAGCVRKVGTLPPLSHVTPEALLEVMNRDKKRQGGRVVHVLLKEIGKPVLAGDVDDRAVVRAWEEARASA